jgi:glycosyltransferase involved in cell wall biosynthesis
MVRAEIEFSLALNSRTGRYFVCRDMIEDTADLIGAVRYWRMSGPVTPEGLSAQVLGKLAAWECKARANSHWFDSLVPRMRRENPVVFTDPLQVLMYRMKSQDVVICHDMGPVSHPELYAPGAENQYRRLFAEMASVCPHMIFVSESSKREYERLYGRSYNSCRVVHPAIRLEVMDGPLEAIPGIAPPFLLTVGSLGIRKNQLRSIQAFAASGLRSQGFGYVVSGGHETGYEAIRELAAKTHSIYLTDYVNEKQLRWLYANAAGFVLPSLLEGFGFPAAEAIVRGVIPLVSRGGALNEITGDAAVLVDPLSVTSIAAGMIAIASLTEEARACKLAALRRHISEITRPAAREGWRSVLEAAIAECEPGPQAREKHQTV